MGRWACIGQGAPCKGEEEEEGKEEGGGPRLSLWAAVSE